MVDPLLCTPISNIVCGGSARPSIFSTFNERYSGKFQGHRMSLACVTKKWFQNTNLMAIYLFNVNNRGTRTRCEVCSKLTIQSKRTFWSLYF